MAEITLEIEGMHCGGCVRRVTQALAVTHGVDKVEEVRVGEARFTSSLEPAPVAEAIEAVNRLGFTAKVKA